MHRGSGTAVLLQQFAAVRRECAALPDGLDQLPDGHEQLAEGDHVELTGVNGGGRAVGVLAAVADEGAAIVTAQEGAGAPVQKIELAVKDDARMQVGDVARADRLYGGDIGVFITGAAFDVGDVHRN